MTSTAVGPGQPQQALARYAILDTPPDREFDELVELARVVTGTPAAALGFHDGDRLWLKSRTGLDSAELDWPGVPLTAPVDAGVLEFSAPVQVGGRSFGFIAAAPIVTSDGFLLGHLMVFDPTARRLAGPEQSALASLAGMALIRLELRRTQMSYHAVINGVGHVVFQTGLDGRLLSVTPTWSRLTGFGIVRCVGQPLEDFVRPEDREQVSTQLREVQLSDTAAVFECRLQRLFGGDVPVEIICRPMVDEVGRRHGLVGVIADISERHARAVEAQHAQKLEALGRLSAGLAHEINTPIQYVGDNTRFLADSYEGMLTLVTAYRQVARDPAFALLSASSREAVCLAEQGIDLDYLVTEIPSAIQASLDGVERVATLVSAMKTFSQPGHDTQAPADLNAALQSVVTVAQNQVAPVADLVCDFHPLPAVTCAIGDLNQIFLNMVVNAADSIHDKGGRGTITISTQRVGDHAVVRVGDTGQGIPEELQHRIFEPFFTTKEVGRGTGQGLALASAVVERHGGTIGLESTVGQGTTFIVSLPIDGVCHPA